MRRLLSCTITLVAGLMILFSSNPRAFAEEVGVSFTITPPVFELKANPGDRLEELISVFNNGSEDVQIGTETQNLKTQGEAGQVQAVDDTGKDALPTLKDWIVVKGESTFSLKKGETKNIKFDINIPADASPGGHFATLLFGNVQSQQNVGKSQVTQKIGSLLLLTVAGSAKEDAAVTTFEPSKKIYWTDQPIDFNLKIQNRGNVYIRPRGFLIITNIFGHKVATIETDGKNILPGSTRQIPLDFNKKGLFGRYTATLTLVYGDSNQNLNYATGLTVIPWKQAVPALVILILLVLLRKRLWKALLILVRGEKKSKPAPKK